MYRTRFPVMLQYLVLIQLIRHLNNDNHLTIMYQIKIVAECEKPSVTHRISRNQQFDFFGISKYFSRKSWSLISFAFAKFCEFKSIIVKMIRSALLLFAMVTFFTFVYCKKFAEETAVENPNGTTPSNQPTKETGSKYVLYISKYTQLQVDLE